MQAAQEATTATLLQRVRAETAAAKKLLGPEELPPAYIRGLFRGRICGGAWGNATKGREMSDMSER